MNTKKIFGFFTAILLSVMMIASCNPPSTPGGPGKTMTIMSYNVENLFDTIDDPLTTDEDFTPGGKLNWTDEKYQVKLQRLAEVISKVDSQLPVIVGLCEVENRKVLDDLVAQPVLKDAHYKVIHKDSPDHRGIDVAFVYDPSRFTEMGHDFYDALLPDPENPNTRDILYVKGKLNGEEIHFFVNHWPSRYRGQEATEPNRIFVATILRKKIDAILAQDAQAKILCMGDFNDYPSDVSVSETLGAGESPSSFLYNYMADDHAQKKGSYYYKGEWGALDQFIASWSLVNAKRGLSAPKEDAFIYKENDILFTDTNGVQRPNRTYAGDSYKGGYSDHLPIYIRIVQK